MFRHWFILICAWHSLDQRCAALSTSYQRTSGFFSSLWNIRVAIIGSSDYLTWLLLIAISRPTDFPTHIYQITWWMNLIGPVTVGLFFSSGGIPGWYQNHRNIAFINPCCLQSCQTYNGENTDECCQLSIHIINLCLCFVDREPANDMMKYSVNKRVSDQ